MKMTRTQTRTPYYLQNLPIRVRLRSPLEPSPKGLFIFLTKRFLTLTELLALSVALTAHSDLELKPLPRPMSALYTVSMIKSANESQHQAN